MKKIALWFTLLIVLQIIWSCDNEPYEGGFYIPEATDNIDIPPNFQNTFSAKLNGQEFVDREIYITTSEGSNNSNFIAINASKTTYHSIIIYLPLNITTGTHHYNEITLLDNPNLNVIYSNLETLLESGSGDGYLTIDVHSSENRHIKGTFECTVNSQNGSIHTITDGTFDVLY